MAKTEEAKLSSKQVVIEDALLLVENVWERDVYKDKDTGAEGKPKYQVVVGFNPDTVFGEGTIEDHLADVIAESYGNDVAEEFMIGGFDYSKRRQDRITPFRDGTAIANDAKKEGKDREASRGLAVLAATSIFNKDGVEGPGGMRVLDMDLTELTGLDKAKVYAGCRVNIQCTFKAYKDYPRKGDRAVTCYLTAVQKIADGEPLRKSGGEGGATQLMFKAVGGTGGAAATGERRRRAG